MAFPNGVAAGDATPTSTVLWARSTVPGEVKFEYSLDSTFGTIAGRASATVSDPAIPIKATIANLEPGRRYVYRVTDASGAIASGQFSTPALGGSRQGLRFGVTGDWQGELAPYPSIGNADERGLNFFVQLGDTLEADSASPALPGVTQASTLEEFRTKHAEIYTERFGVNNWADLRATTTTYGTWDDHEITNDFAGGAAPTESPQKNGLFGTVGTFVNETPAFAAGLQAFQDYKPLATETYGDTGDPRTANKPKLYRYRTFGDDAAMMVLDVRSFRDKPLRFLPETSTDAQVAGYLQEAFAPGRTMLGAAQLAELKQDLLSAQQSGKTWKFVMSTVPMQHFGVAVSGERWEGFAAERNDLLQFITNNRIENVVFVTGDFHGNVVNNVTYQTSPDSPQRLTDVLDVMIGPAAIQLNIGSGPFAAPFSRATVAFTPTALLPQTQKDRFAAFTTSADRNAFAQAVVDARLNKLGYDTTGLTGSNLDAQLLQGTYFAADNYGWSEFGIDPATQALTVTTYGVEPYTQSQIEADPTIATRSPTIRQQFTVNAQRRIVGTEAPDSLTGDALNNVIAGRGGNDVIAGGAGNDILVPGPGQNTLDGGDGVDTVVYTPSSVGVVVDLKTEVAIQGFDPNANPDTLPNTFVSVENLAGSEFADTLTGTAAGNILTGGGGADWLTGDGGADVFFYRNGADGGDTIADFGPDDALWLSASGFGNGLAAARPLNATDDIGIFAPTGAFVAGPGAIATSAQATVLYDTTTGLVSFDPDGTGSLGAGAIATLSGTPTLSASQIAIVS